MRHSKAVEASAARALFLLMAVALGVVGAWASLAPDSFYRSFPGLGGRHWLPPLGPYNEHMVRDFGGLNLGLAAAALVAAIALTRSAAVCAAAAWEAYSLPHLAFHASHTEPYSASDNLLNLVVLSLAVVAPVVACALTWRVTQRADQDNRSANTAAPHRQAMTDTMSGPRPAGVNSSRSRSRRTR